MYTCLLIRVRQLLPQHWRGLWTWPPWLICALAFNHKLKKFCIYRGFSESIFLKKPHNRAEELRIGQWKGYYMNIAAQELPKRRTNSKWPTDRWNCKRPNNSLMWPTIVLSLFFPCRNFCAENFVIIFYEIKLLFTYLKKDAICLNEHYFRKVA